MACNRLMSSTLLLFKWTISENSSRHALWCLCIKKKWLPTARCRTLQLDLCVLLLSCKYMFVGGIDLNIIMARLAWGKGAEQHKMLEGLAYLGSCCARSVMPTVRQRDRFYYCLFFLCLSIGDNLPWQNHCWLNH